MNRRYMFFHIASHTSLTIFETVKNPTIANHTESVSCCQYLKYIVKMDINYIIYIRLLIDDILSSGKTAKHEWKKLRDCFRQALARKKTPIGQAVKKTKLWRYEKQMEFLIPFMMPRE